VIRSAEDGVGAVQHAPVQRTARNAESFEDLSPRIATRRSFPFLLLVARWIRLRDCVLACDEVESERRGWRRVAPEGGAGAAGEGAPKPINISRGSAAAAAAAAVVGGGGGPRSSPSRSPAIPVTYALAAYLLLNLRNRSAVTTRDAQPAQSTPSQAYHPAPCAGVLPREPHEGGRVTHRAGPQRVRWGRRPRQATAP
jgi:hypothetical protein